MTEGGHGKPARNRRGLSARGRRLLRLLWERHILGRSPLFDGAWYLERYPDVRAAGRDPRMHYLLCGAAEGRDPGPAFSTTGYLAARPDVAAARINPLVHYLRHGGAADAIKEAPGMKPRPAAPEQRETPPPRQPPIRPPLPGTALVVAWDVGHNPLGRAYMLAEVLQRVYRRVVLAGFQFERYGDAVWEPVRDGALPVVRLPGEPFPDFSRRVREVAARTRPDVVFACKPRLPSLQLAAMIKQATGCPLVLDIDDHELSFFPAEDGDAVPLPLDPGEAGRHPLPFDGYWTRAADALRDCADAILVSNAALEQSFGGMRLPHVRDERSFDPALHDRAARRREFGIPLDSRVILFFGTPRKHKGIDVIARAVRKLAEPGVRLVIAGVDPGAALSADLRALSSAQLTLLPRQPFASIPRVVALADLVCLPQDPAHPTSAFQLPAKAIDALAMGIPMLVTPTPPLAPIIAAGGATAIAGEEELAQQIRSWLHAPVRERRRHAARARELFRARYSHAAAASRLVPLLRRLKRRDAPASLPSLQQLIAGQARAFPEPPRDLGGPGTDVVIFWKQNDGGLYGRRVDMVAKYLASRPDVRRVLVLDAPISEHSLHSRRGGAHELTQWRRIFIGTLEKALGAHDAGKLHRDVLIYPSGRYRHTDAAPDEALGALYVDFLRERMQRLGIDPHRAIFWFYPRNPLAPCVISELQPARVVVDVVDDHRAWPDVTPQQRQAYTNHYREMLACADMAFANCTTVRDSLASFHADLRVVPNGCDPQPADAGEIRDSRLERVKRHPGKKIGFVGNLEKKIDIALLQRLARSRPDCLLVLVGSTHANAAARTLASEPNVLMPGVVPYAEVGAWIRAFDLAIIPHLDMPLTRSMNPLKLYVYLSYGIPVVATHVRNIDASSGLVSVAASGDEFLDAVDRALEQGRPDPASVRAYVQANSWESRFRAPVDELLSGTRGSGTARQIGIEGDVT